MYILWLQCSSAQLLVYFSFTYDNSTDQYLSSSFDKPSRPSLASYEFADRSDVCIQPTTTMFILDLSDKDQNGSEYLAELEAYRALDTFEWNSTSYAGRLSRVSSGSQCREFVT